MKIVRWGIKSTCEARFLEQRGQIELLGGWPYAKNEDENKFFRLDKLPVEETKKKKKVSDLEWQGKILHTVFSMC